MVAGLGLCEPRQKWSPAPAGLETEWGVKRRLNYSGTKPSCKALHHPVSRGTQGKGEEPFLRRLTSQPDGGC